MRGTVRALLERRAADVLGRERERGLLLEMVERDRPLVTLVHGIAGVGKTTLVRAFAADARARGARVAVLDGRGGSARLPTRCLGIPAACGDGMAEDGIQHPRRASVAILQGRDGTHLDREPAVRRPPVVRRARKRPGCLGRDRRRPIKLKEPHRERDYLRPHEVPV